MFALEVNEKGQSFVAVTVAPDPITHELKPTKEPKKKKEEISK